jgi:tetratricopeptide (TPR) repeat protein
MPQVNRRASARGKDRDPANPSIPYAEVGVAASSPVNWLLNPSVLVGILVVATLLAFSPLFTAEFCNWDDQDTVSKNPLLNPPTVGNVLHVWNPRNPQMDLYVPVTYTVWSVVSIAAYVEQPDANGVHLNPWVFHGTNILIHATSALVVFALLRQLLLGRFWGGKLRAALPRADLAAATGALLFALHPVQVETVGWVSGTKDLLFGLFSLLALWQYLQFAELSDVAAAASETSRSRRRWLHYGLGILCFALGMLSKPTAIVVPIAAGALDLFLLRRPWKRIARDLVPWVLLAIPCVIEGRLAQPVTASSFVKVALVHRPFIAGDALAFYLYKLIFPASLGFPYGRAPDIVLAHAWGYFTWIIPVTLGVIFWIWRRQFPWLLAGGAVMVIGVLPVLGLVPFDFQSYSTVSDHYFYLAMLGPALAAAYFMAGLHGASTLRAAWGTAGVVLLVLGIRSVLQTQHWHDSMAVTGHAVEVSPESAPDWAAYGRLCFDRGRIDDALLAFTNALRIAPEESASHSNYAFAIAAKGRFEEAEAEYHEALRLKPSSKSAKYGLSLVLAARDAARNAAGAATRPAMGPGPAVVPMVLPTIPQSP